MSNTRFYARAALGVAVGVLSIAFLPLSGVLTVRAEGAELLPDVAARGDVAGVRRLLDGGTPADTRQPSTGWTALIAACRANRAGVATLLLERGANPNAAGGNGYTPLMAAAQAGNVPLLRTLLLRGADPNRATRKGLTPLMVAAGNANDVKTAPVNLECVKLLLRGGADPDKQYGDGVTALSVAESRGATLIAVYLRRVGAARNGAGDRETALVGNGVLAGSVLYRERIAVSPAAFSLVRLLDVSPKVPVVLSRAVTPFAGKQVPVAFSLPYAGARLAARPNARLAMDARIILGCATEFASAKPVPVPGDVTKNKNIILAVTRTGGAQRALLAGEAINATDLAIRKAGVSVSGRRNTGDLRTKYTASFLGGRLVRITANSTQGDYGNRTDRFYFGEGADSEGFLPLRAAFLHARRVSRTQPSLGGGVSAIILGSFDQVEQKIILGDGGEILSSGKTVNRRQQSVTGSDTSAARNFARLLASDATRAAAGRRGR